MLKKEQVTALQTGSQKILEMKKPGNVKINIEADIKVKQRMTLETHKMKTNVDFQ